MSTAEGLPAPPGREKNHDELGTVSAAGPTAPGGAVDSAGPPRVANQADAPAITRMLTDAFRDDSLWGDNVLSRWASGRDLRQAVFRLFVDAALPHSWVWLAAGDVAVAVWYPPGVQEMSAEEEQQLEALLISSLGSGSKQMLAALELFNRARPEQPHYYLGLLASAPAHAGRGHAQRLLAANLRQVDAANAPAYLECEDPLVRLYERFGFELLHRFELPHGPWANTMWRPAQAGG